MFSKWLSELAQRTNYDQTQIKLIHRDPLIAAPDHEQQQQQEKLDSSAIRYLDHR